MDSIRVPVTVLSVPCFFIDITDRCDLSAWFPANGIFDEFWFNNRKSVSEGQVGRKWA